MIDRIAEFLKMRDESVLPEETSDEERRESAKAIIELMREPTPEMILANSDAAGPDDQQTIDDWRAMIDAALREETAQ